MRTIVFIDTEIDPQTERILDLGAVKPDGSTHHTPSQRGFAAFINDTDFLCLRSRTIEKLLLSRNVVRSVSTLTEPEAASMVTLPRWAQ